MIGVRIIQRLIQEKIIKSHREIFQDPNKLQKASENGAFSESERSKLIQISKIKVSHSQYLEKAYQCQLWGIHSISISDKAYPRSLAQLSGMPIILYVKGDQSLLYESGNSVAVVGTRNPSGYGIRATEEIVEALSERGMNIISGLARGIDTVAHQAALRKGKKTIAVMPCGLDRIYPSENKDLFDQIGREGLLISEMPPGQAAIRRYFPARNRIMSALSDAVAIMEAGEFSGTLHTASFAVAQGRDVFVLPGGIYSPFCKGNLMLLRDGAELLLSAEDILFSLSESTFFREIDKIRNDLRKNSLHEAAHFSSDKISKEDLIELIAEELKSGDKTIDELVGYTNIPFQFVAPVLSELLLSGAISEKNKRFALTFPYL